jgi:type IV secretory pathway TraG/TraD family ATPase VirD4
MRRRKNTKEDVVASQPQPLVPEGTPGRPWYGCYLGDPPSPGPTDNTLPVSSLYAGTETATLIIGPPRSGKTSALVIPTVLDAPAAVVSTSTKPDVLMATAWRRIDFGRAFVFDPSGSVSLPRWVTRLRWSPVVGCETFDHAVAMAHALAQAARPGASLTESAHWVERAEALLAPLLFAAALGGQSIASLCQWVLARDLREPQAVITAAGHELAGAILMGVAATDERERSGIFSTAAGLLSAYRSDAVLESARTPNFDPVAFAASSDTLYICAPSQVQDQLAPLVVALLEAIRAATFARPTDAAPVVFALDEVANIAPLASLPALAAEGGGHGLVTLACLQDLSQARFRWGEVAEGFLTLFGAKVILPGIADYRTLQLISALAGDHDVETTTIGRTVGNYGRIRPSVSVSKVRRPRLPVDAIARGTPGHGLLISGTQMAEVRLRPWWQHAYWDAETRIPPGASWDDLCQHDPG